MVKNIFLMLVIIVPTFIALFITVGKYHSKKSNAPYDPEHSHGKMGVFLLWTAPSIIVIILALITWKETHELDPFKPIQSDVKPLEIQVVALDWKWLFIYPDQGIATINYLQIPDKTPVHFSLAADGSPMNSFWIPQLSGQIYCMTGMVTKLHVMADGPGEYMGKANEINGDGFADMFFKVKSTSKNEFNHWIAKVKQSPLRLTDAAYQELLKPSMKYPVTLYSFAEKDLFTKIINKYMPQKKQKP